MLSVTLEPNRSNPQRFVATLTYERKGDKVTPVYRVYDGPGHVKSVKVIPWNQLGDKDWSTSHSGKRSKQGRPFTIKRDWLLLHQELELIRLEEATP